MKLIFNYLILLSFVGALGAVSQQAPSRIGVLIMAHGGDSAWNAAVERSADSVGARWPTAVALGMAKREAMAGGLETLRQEGVTHVVVVPMFVSAESFRPRTTFFLGLSANPPAPMGPTDSLMAPIPHHLQVALAEHGLVDDVTIGDLLAMRASLVSTDPSRESVLIVAHGMGDDSANQRLLDAMHRMAQRLEHAVPFHRVVPLTLREDWSAPRKIAEQGIRDLVLEEATAGRVPIVVPLRLFGFGPYAEVLDGLLYRPAPSLAPHPIVNEWLVRQVERTIARVHWPQTVAFPR